MRKNSYFCLVVTLSCGEPLSPIATRPLADAGLDQVVKIGTEITIDAQNSKISVATLEAPTAETPLTYQWQLIAKPSTSNTKLVRPQAVETRFIVDTEGMYLLSLTVTYEQIASLADEMLITARNLPPQVTLCASNACACGAATCLVEPSSTVDLVSQVIDPDNVVENLQFRWQQITDVATCGSMCPALLDCQPSQNALYSLPLDEFGTAIRITIPEQTGANYVFALTVSDGTTEKTQCTTYKTPNP